MVAEEGVKVISGDWAYAQCKSLGHAFGDGLKSVMRTVVVVSLTHPALGCGWWSELWPILVITYL